MASPKPRKFFLSLLLILLVCMTLAFIFRNELLFKFQYRQIKSLNCKSSSKNNCLQRLWVHRVNSLQRYYWLQDKFQGFETDIFFNDSLGNFQVYHPPMPPANDTLSFVSYLKHVDLSAKKFWLDTRNVRTSNVTAAITALDATGQSAELKKTSLVEVYDPGAAAILRAAGYEVAINMQGISVNRMSQENYRDSIKNILKDVSYVSDESSQISLMKKLFPEKKIITWHLYFNDYFKLINIQKLLDDPQIAVILLNIKSPYFR